jgi:hypothetical protein
MNKISCIPSKFDFNFQKYYLEEEKTMIICLAGQNLIIETAEKCGLQKLSDIHFQALQQEKTPGVHGIYPQIAKHLLI